MIKYNFICHPSHSTNFILIRLLNLIISVLEPVKKKKNETYKSNSNVIYVMKNTDQNDKIPISNTKFTYKCRSWVDNINQLVWFRFLLYFTHVYLEASSCSFCIFDSKWRNFCILYLCVEHVSKQALNFITEDWKRLKVHAWMRINLEKINVIF